MNVDHQTEMKILSPANDSLIKAILHEIATEDDDTEDREPSDRIPPEEMYFPARDTGPDDEDE